MQCRDVTWMRYHHQHAMLCYCKQTDWPRVVLLSSLPLFTPGYPPTTYCIALLQLLVFLLYSPLYCTHYPPLTLSLPLSLSSLVVGRSRCDNCDTANAVTRTYYRSIQASDRQVPCLSLARRTHVHSALNAHTYTHADTKIVARLSSQPALCFCCLAAKCGVQLSMCLRGCRGTGRAPLQYCCIPNRKKKAENSGFRMDTVETRVAACCRASSP